jgi:SAM-dependent methyltransferase
MAKRQFNTDPQARWRALAQWLESDLGARALVEERALLDARLPGLYGFHLLQLGVSDRVCLYDSSMIRHRFVLGRSTEAPGASARALPEQLPIEPDSVDVVILHHVLEYSEQPHQVLREAARVVVPHGHLLIVGFNPWSLFGVRAAASRRFGHPVWSGATLGTRRVEDWLALLDFAVEDVQYRFHVPPIDHAPTLARLARFDRAAARWSLPCGAVYLVHARKQVSPLTPVRAQRRFSRPRLAAVPLASPSTRDTIH